MYPWWWRGHGFSHAKTTSRMSLSDRYHEIVRVDEAVLSRAGELEQAGLMGMDAVHVACAERAGRP